jgi:hypothetical protein
MIASNGKAPAIRSSLHDSIHMIHREDWMNVAEGASPYLQYDHLAALEDAMNGSMDFRYGIHYCEQNQPMGITYFQVADLVDNGSAYRSGVQKLGKGIGGRIIKDMKVHCLVSGNVFHCGDHGSYFKPEVSTAHRLLVVEDTLRRFDKGCYFKPRTNVLIVKELWPEQYHAAEALEEKSYAPLAMEVNMVMELDTAWKDLDTYQEALNAKARTRLRSVLKRSAKLEVGDMSATAIRNAAPRLQELFDQVLERSPFVFGRLNVGVYPAWKTHWKSDLIFRSYHLDGELVGFATAFVLGDTLDVQYVGFDYALNEQHGIYQRMLVDLLEVGLQRGVRRILFGRTAEQAKSNLGAQPVDMRFYVKHHNALANKLVGPFLRSIRPAPFEQRAPFKAVIA